MFHMKVFKEDFRACEEPSITIGPCLFCIVTLYLMILHML